MTTHVRRVLRSILLALGTACLASFAQTEPAGSGEPAAVLWSCWYAPERTGVACRLVRAPGVASPTPIASATMLGRVRNDPASLEGEAVVIPLHGPPLDMGRVATLARAVMCGARPSCEVDFRSGP